MTFRPSTGYHQCAIGHTDYNCPNVSASTLQTLGRERPILPNAGMPNRPERRILGMPNVRQDCQTQPNAKSPEIAISLKL